MAKKRGSKSKFLEFTRTVKQNQFRYLYIRNKLAKLKEEGIDLSTQGYLGQTLLHIAVKLRNLKLLNIFIKAGVNLDVANEMGETPLHLAVMNNEIKLCKALIVNGCDI
ncbi:MAG TPA: ankyrin repeat domain-containing protein, partial [Bacilli bacterium]|nr:ankyrin repeat domain-containing protein [Bacilli bacterium]